MKFSPLVPQEKRDLLNGRLLDDSYVDNVEADPLNGELVVTVIVRAADSFRAGLDAADVIPSRPRFAAYRPKTDTQT